MSTEILNYEELLSSMAKEATAAERPSTSSLSFRSGILALNKTPVPGNKLDVIVLGSRHANALYTAAYDPDNIASPDCYAYGEDEASMTPHPSVLEPKSDKCSTCPMNAWGSDPKGGKGKACKNSRVLAVIPADTKPDSVMDAEVAIAKLPVTSGQNWGNYVNKIGTLFNRPPLGMITQIGVVPDLKTQLKVTFMNVAPVDVGMIKPLIDRSATLGPLLERVYEPNVEAPAEDTTKKKKF